MKPKILLNKLGIYIHAHLVVKILNKTLSQHKIHTNRQIVVGFLQCWCHHTIRGPNVEITVFNAMQLTQIYSFITKHYWIIDNNTQLWELHFFRLTMMLFPPFKTYRVGLICHIMIPPFWVFILIVHYHLITYYIV